MDDKIHISFCLDLLWTHNLKPVSIPQFIFFKLFAFAKLNFSQFFSIFFYFVLP